MVSTMAQFHLLTCSFLHRQEDSVFQLFFRSSGRTGIIESEEEDVPWSLKKVTLATTLLFLSDADVSTGSLLILTLTLRFIGFINPMFCLNQATFNAPVGDELLASDVSSMAKGQVKLLKRQLEDQAKEHQEWK
ncbi:hypothetical protein Tco_0540067 [Tanacetum coccineum]